MMRWNCVKAACGQVSRPRRARRDHDVLQEHAVVEPAALLHDAVDGEDQPDRRVEEVVVAAVLRVHARLVGLADAEQAVQVPADLAAPVDVGRRPLRRVVGVLLAVRARARRGRRRRRGSPRDRRCFAAPVSTCTFHGCVLVPEGARAATAQDVLDRLARHRRGQEGADRAARGDGGVDGAAWSWSGVGHAVAIRGCRAARRASGSSTGRRVARST